MQFIITYFRFVVKSFGIRMHKPILKFIIFKILSFYFLLLGKEIGKVFFVF